MWFLYLLRLHPSSTLFPYTTLFRSCGLRCRYWQRRSTPLGTPSERRGLRPARTRRCRARQVRSFVGRAVWLANLPIGHLDVAATATFSAAQLAGGRP